MHWTASYADRCLRDDLELPVLLRNLNLVYVYTVFVPALCFADLDIVPAHLSLAHAAVIGESPVLGLLACTL